MYLIEGLDDDDKQLEEVSVARVVRERGTHLKHYHCQSGPVGSWGTTESPPMPPLQVRELFGLYDADGSGELDKDEFIEVLIATGKN